ncbi:unnamed protein product [marine sediment metagenome]|uniref:Uncharacterized protein n=1 Tax=marine sediment metagenome TaxID=412755 RepID=X1HQR4_9ZZZZ
MVDIFRFKTDQEIKKMISDFWEDLEYLVKIRILLKAYPKFNITKLEERNINKLWKALSLERQKEIYQDQYKYQI